MMDRLVEDALAAEVRWTRNARHSHRDYTGLAGQALRNSEPSEWGGTEVVGTCFSQETPNTRVFPDGVRRLRLVGCNLDNVWIDPGWEVEGCSTRRYQVQADGHDWLLDETGKPTLPVGADLVIAKASRLPEMASELDAALVRAVEQGIVAEASVAPHREALAVAIGESPAVRGAREDLRAAVERMEALAPREAASELGALLATVDERAEEREEVSGRGLQR